ncbi:MAG: hypothetical protein H0W70_04015 [Actinobacteria bacterium]|nr:hypothetical protein [Actinomycetota bacterium]
MTDIDKERDRLDEVERHIEEAEDKAKDLLEPHATLEGGPRSTDDDEPGDQERVTPDAER